MKPPLDLPLPSGWFCVGLSSEVPSGAIRTIPFMGEEWALFRTAAGIPGLLGAHCPHLGAHMGHGGRVEGETLRCPFHGFHFTPSGACKAAYGGTPPARLKAESLPLREKHGLLLAYHHPAGRAPDWEIPDLDPAGFSPFFAHRFHLRGHPQETTENSVDTGHFGTVHGFTDLETLHTSTDGPLLRADYRFRRFVGKGKLGFHAQVEIHVEVRGLGYSLVDVRVPALGMRTRQLVLPTPAEKDHIDLRIAIAAEDAKKLRWIGPLLPGFTTGVLARALLSVYKDDVAQDFAIWENKRYVPKPILARGDGPIMLYRKWATQFYDASGEDGTPLLRASRLAGPARTAQRAEGPRQVVLGEHPRHALEQGTGLHAATIAHRGPRNRSRRSSPDRPAVPAARSTRPARGHFLW